MVNDNYFNTTGLKGQQLKLAIENASTQEQLVLEVFNTLKSEIYTASDVFKYYEGGVHNAPLTSWRRAITCLKNKGILAKTLHKKTGLYGKPEYYYQLNTANDE